MNKTQSLLKTKAWIKRFQDKHKKESYEDFKKWLNK